jgi:hypothetical protein
VLSLEVTWRLGGVDVNAGSHDLLVGDLTPEASMMSPVGYLALQDSREGARHEEHERRRRVRHGNTQAGEGTTTSTSTMTLVGFPLSRYSHRAPPEGRSLSTAALAAFLRRGSSHSTSEDRQLTTTTLRGNKKIRLYEPVPYQRDASIHAGGVMRPWMVST